MNNNFLPSSQQPPPQPIQPDDYGDIGNIGSHLSSRNYTRHAEDNNNDTNKEDEDQYDPGGNGSPKFITNLDNNDNQGIIDRIFIPLGVNSNNQETSVIQSELTRIPCTNNSNLKEVSDCQNEADFIDEDFYNIPTSSST